MPKYPGNELYIQQIPIKTSSLSWKQERECKISNSQHVISDEEYW